MIPVLVGGMEGMRPPRVPPPGRTGRPAGVLVLLYPDADGLARVVLTERATRDGHHSGEVSFPGGAAEPGDADITATALARGGRGDRARRGCRRRCASSGSSIGSGSRSATSMSRRSWPSRSAGRSSCASPAEVARIVEPPVARFLPGAPVEIVERTIRDWPLRYGAYDVDGLSVWGATARILSQLGAVLAR